MTSTGDLFTGALYKTSSLKSAPGHNLQRFNAHELRRRSRNHTSNAQKVPRRLRRRNQNRHRAMTRAIRHARTPQKVARTETKNVSLSPATFPRKTEHGASARVVKAIRHTQTPQRVLRICKGKIGTAPQRDSKSHQNSNNTLTSASQKE